MWLIMEAMTVETFEYYQEKERQLISDGILDKPLFSSIYNKINYEDELRYRPRQIHDYTARYFHWEKLGEIYILSGQRFLMKDMLYIYNLLGINATVIMEEHRKTIGLLDGEKPYYFTIPLVYELRGDTVLVYVDTDGIISPDYLTLETIKFLTMFGNSYIKTEE
jgi:hypothetical protein